MKTYPDIDPETLGTHYEKHIVAMTVERLESKADIATQLALRDQEIERLRDTIALIGTEPVADGDYYSEEAADIEQSRARAADAATGEWVERAVFLADEYVDAALGHHLGHRQQTARRALRSHLEAKEREHLATKALLKQLAEALKYARRMVKPSECDSAYIDAALAAQQRYVALQEKT
jgi:hypothetical protein